MKKLMIIGAMIGFASTLVLGVLQHAPWPELLWRATVVCFAASVLFRWWGSVWLRSFREAHIQRLQATVQTPQPAKL